MNAAIVVIGHLTNPFDLLGSFSVQFSAEDFSSNGSSSKGSSRGFNLTVDAGFARPSAIHFLIIRLEDGLRFEGFLECPSGKRSHDALTGQFASPDRSEPSGRVDVVLHWNGTEGNLTANFTAPRS